MIKVVLHGYLKDLYPHPINMAADTVAELINGVCKQTKAFNPKPGEERHTIKVVGFDTPESLYQPLEQDEVHLVPAFCGGKGFFKIVLGAVLIASAIAFPSAFPVTVGGLTILTASGVFWMGAALALGGLLELISPAPTVDTDPNDPEASKYLGEPKNTVKIGTRIPLLYGERMVYGHYLSFDIDAKRVEV